MREFLCNHCHSRINGDCLSVSALESTSIPVARFSLIFSVRPMTCCNEHATKSVFGGPGGPGGTSFTVPSAEDARWCSFTCFVDWMKFHLTRSGADKALNIEALNSKPARKEMASP